MLYLVLTLFLTDLTAEATAFSGLALRETDVLVLFPLLFFGDARAGWLALLLLPDCSKIFLPPNIFIGFRRLGDPVNSVEWSFVPNLFTQV